METLYFSHIPKTAGTSLRLAAIKRFGAKRVVCDYGDTRHTSDVVRDLVHQKQDYFAFQEYLLKNKVKILAAHAPMRYYRRLFPSNNIITFVRDPVERLVSHYHTAVRFQQYPHTLIRFCRESQYQNVQSAYFAQMPPELVGFIGLTERYEDSLKLLRSQYGHAFVQLNLNRHVHKERHSSHAANLDEWTLNMIHELNQEDIALYRVCRELFETRLRASERYRTYVNGRVTGLQSQYVKGWAAPSLDTDAVVIDVLVNDVPYQSIQASQYLPELKERNAPRAGYVGYQCRFDPPLQAGDKVVCRVHGGEQILRGPSQVPYEADLPMPQRASG